MIILTQIYLTGSYTQVSEVLSYIKKVFFKVVELLISSVSIADRVYLRGIIEPSLVFDVLIMVLL
jgi:hypothetical protein